MALIALQKAKDMVEAIKKENSELREQCMICKEQVVDKDGVKDWFCEKHVSGNTAL
tara:strand:+ start:273 stop:440 length:168 start_codon:yes stop_codon:yes gene_type:complete